MNIYQTKVNEIIISQIKRYMGNIVQNIKTKLKK